MSKLYTRIPVPKFPRSEFSLSRSAQGSVRRQVLYAPEVLEVIPGDGFSIAQEALAKVQPMIAPVFGKMDLLQESFFVPGWQLHQSYDDFITGGEKNDFTDHLPYFHVGDMYDSIDQALGFFPAYILGGGSVSPKQYNDALEKIVSVIEMMDWMRAIPFKKPDFQAATTIASVSTVASANLNAWEVLNLQFNGSELRVNYLPILAYQKTFCEFYRDENLMPDFWTIIREASGTYLGNLLCAETDYVWCMWNSLFSSATNLSDFEDMLLEFYWIFGFKHRAWKKDRYTAALPWVQKGPDVLLPLEGTFPVDFTTTSGSTSGSNVIETHGSGSGALETKLFSGSASDAHQIKGSVSLNATGLGTTITDLRRAVRLEEFYEAEGRGGNRYPENVLSQFGIHCPDARLPRGQFQRSCSQPVSIQEVVQNSETASTPQGNLAGRGTSYGNGVLCRNRFTLHGFIICMFSVRTKAVYEGGIHPMFSRFDRTEYAWPRFANLGEEPVYDKELFVNSSTGEDDVFGYVPRYSTYKSDQSSVHGALKTSLQFWTLSRRFSTKPTLSESFICADPRSDMFAVSNPFADQIVVEIDYKVRVSRLLPYFGVPML